MIIIVIIVVIFVIIVVVIMRVMIRVEGVRCVRFARISGPRLISYKFGKDIARAVG